MILFPKILIALLLVASLAYAIKHHRKRRPPWNAWLEGAGISLTALLLWWGDFWTL